MNVNEVRLLGNLSKAPKLLETQGGMAYCFLTVCTNRSKKKEDGEWESIPEFTGCIAFGKTAERLAERGVKGSKIYVDGRIQTTSTKNDDDSFTTKVQIIVEKAFILDKQEQGEGGEEKKTYTPRKSNYPQTRTLQEAEENIEKRTTRNTYEEDVSLESVPF